MRHFIFFWQTLLIIGVFGSLTFAQDIPNSSRLAAPLGHVSAGGRFAIMLPPNPTAQRRISPGEGTRGGMQYFWRTPDGEFFASYYDNSAKPADAKQELEAMRDNYVSGIVKNGGKLLEKKDLTLDKNIGLEFRTSLKTGETVFIRYYSVEKRIFILSTRWNPKETGKKQLEILDSFRLVTGK